MSFKIVYCPLTKAQIKQIQACGCHGSPAKITLTKQQLERTSLTLEPDFSVLPLTAFQLRLFNQALAAGVDWLIFLNLHQEKQFLSSNLGIDIDISNASVSYQHRKRIFRKPN